MTLRQSVARRVEFAAGLIDAAVFLCGFPDEFVDYVTVEMTFQVRSKAEADEIIEMHSPAARPLWRNGVYMAELEPAKLPVPPGWRALLPPGLRSKLPSGYEERSSGTVFEMHFVPPITEQDAA